VDMQNDKIRELINEFGESFTKEQLFEELLEMLPEDIISGLHLNDSDYYASITKDILNGGIEVIQSRFALYEYDDIQSGGAFMIIHRVEDDRYGLECEFLFVLTGQSAMFRKFIPFSHVMNLLMVINLVDDYSRILHSSIERDEIGKCINHEVKLRMTPREFLKVVFGIED